MRPLLLLAAVASCGAPERAASSQPEPLVAPGLRLPGDVTPLSYDLALDVDPARETFQGEVSIEIRLERPTDHVWLHLDAIVIQTATWSGGALTMLPVRGEQMRAFSFGRVVPAGTTTLHFTYHGATTGDQEGLFRQHADAWYLFTQGQSVFTRRITPCFDEPRWKTPWRVSVVAPAGDVVLSNAREASTVAVGKGRRRVTFETTPPMPSYLLALAVGPFELVDAGTVGRKHVPVRVAVRGHRRHQVDVAAARLPAVVRALETYLDDDLPLAKLDLVAVPQFFGAMENPGLVTFHEPILVGDARKDSFADYFTYIAAHELAHQWFGNLVTPSWWDHLWLSEAFASWLGDKVVRELDSYDDPALRFVLARRDAIAADEETDTRPLWRHVTTTVDADEGFDAIAYAKGQLVLGTFESFVGTDVFRDRVRAYLQAERGRSVTSSDFLSDIGLPALEQYAATTGTPVVELALRCTTNPVVVAHARTGAVPVCVRAGSSGTGSGTRRCALVRGTVEIPVSDRAGACPAWVEGNPDGGYYHVAWTTNGPRGPARPPSELDATSRMIAGDDLAAAVQRGELSARDAVAQLRALADSHEVYAQLGALALVRAIDDLVDAATRPAWTAFVAARFADRLAIDRRPAGPAENELFTALVSIVPPDRFAGALTRRASASAGSLVTVGDEGFPPGLVGLAVAHPADKLLTQIVERALVERDEDVRDAWVAALGEVTSAQAEFVVALLARGELPFDTLWAPVGRLLARPATRDATWDALVPRLSSLWTRLAVDERRELLRGASHLCDTGRRAQVAAAFAADAERASTLSAIDTCIVRRDKLGDLTSAL